jgi:hypothetical protein
MSSVSNTIRDAAKDAKDAGREAGQAASAGARDIQADLLGLRDDVARLTHQIADIFAGTASWQRAKSDLDGVISDAGEKGREAIGVVREGRRQCGRCGRQIAEAETIHRARARGRPRLPVRSHLETLSSVFRSAKSLQILGPPGEYVELVPNERLPPIVPVTTTSGEPSDGTIPTLRAHG